MPELLSELEEAQQAAGAVFNVRAAPAADARMALCACSPARCLAWRREVSVRLALLAACCCAPTVARPVTAARLCSSLLACACAAGSRKASLPCPRLPAAGRRPGGTLHQRQPCSVRSGALRWVLKAASGKPAEPLCNSRQSRAAQAPPPLGAAGPALEGGQRGRQGSTPPCVPYGCPVQGRTVAGRGTPPLRVKLCAEQGCAQSAPGCGPSPLAALL